MTTIRLKCCKKFMDRAKCNKVTDEYIIKKFRCSICKKEILLYIKRYE